MAQRRGCDGKAYLARGQQQKRLTMNILKLALLGYKDRLSLKRFANAVPASDTEGRMWDTGGEAMLTEN